jgi:hypothetical protein
LRIFVEGKEIHTVGWMPFPVIASRSASKENSGFWISRGPVKELTNDPLIKAKHCIAKTPSAK